MKKIYTLLTLALLGMVPMLTSCDDEDEMISNSLQGIWRGQIRSEYYYGRYGRETQYTDTQIEFYSDPYRYARGTGREMDYDEWGYGDVVYFDYTVRNGYIYMDYSDGTHIIIENWNIYRDVFEGDFHDYRTGEYLASFRLYYVSGGWDSSFRGYDWYGDYYSKQHSDLFPDEEE